MPEDISQPVPAEIYYAAEQYMPCLPEDLRAPLRDMLEHTQAGEKRDNAILLLLSEDKEARRWMRRALFYGDLGAVRGDYNPLAGLPGEIPANSVWICPQCGFEWRVLRAGRPVPPCPKDGSALVRDKGKRRKKVSHVG